MNPLPLEDTNSTVEELIEGPSFKGKKQVSPMGRRKNGTIGHGFTKPIKKRCTEIGRRPYSPTNHVDVAGAAILR